MKVVIGNKSLGIFIKALKFLAKYSPEYILEAKDNKFYIKTCSTTQISLAIATFEEFFFVKYEVSDKREDNICRVSAKVLLHILKSPKSIASCTLEFDTKKDCLYLNIHKHNDFIVKNSVSLLDFDELDEYVTPKEVSELIFQPSVFRRVLQSSKGIDELEFQFGYGSVMIKSYIDYPDEDCEAIRLDFSIQVPDFTVYRIISEQTLVASCDDFVILLNLAQSLDMEVSMQFSVPGRPMISTLKIDGAYTLSLVQATLPPKSLKRNIRNHSYKQIVKNYMERRTGADEISTVNDGGIDRVVNTNIMFTSQSKSQELLNIKDKSNNESKEKSSKITHVSTPSALVRGKRKSVDENNINDLNVTVDELQQKRQKTAMDSTVIGCNASIILSQNEINEVNDIMLDIASFCGIEPNDNDQEMNPVADIQLLPSQSSIHSNREEIIENYPQNEVNENKSIQNTDEIDLANSDKRWSLHNSYFTGSEDVEMQENNSVEQVRQNRLGKYFSHISKPYRKASFGRVIIEGSDPESDENL